MEIVNIEEKKALSHYDNLNYYDQTKFINAALTADQLKKIINKYCNILTNKSILDFGAGIGQTTEYICSNYKIKSCDAVDYSQKRMDVLNKRMIKYKNVTTYVEDVNLFVNRLNKYDVIFAFEIIEHLIKPEAVIKKLKDMLLPGGVLIGTIPYQKQPNGVHLSAFLNEVDVNQRLAVNIDNTIKLRFENQRVFYFQKTHEA